MRRILRPQSWIPIIAGVLFGLVLDVLVNQLMAAGGWLLTAVLVLAGVFGIAAIWLRIQPKPIVVRMESPITLRHPADRSAYARRGLIVFVSLYQPQAGSPAESLSVEQRLQAAGSGDYATLDLLHSNLATAIKSVVSHRSRLEYCWLIGTTAAAGDQVGSLPFVKPLVSYLEDVEGIQCRFYADESLTIPLDDDALVASKTQARVTRIFQEADALQLAEQEMVADFSGCPRSMALGMILACVDRNRDIQFVGTHYDDRAQPVGDSYPILFAFEAELDGG